MKRKWENEPLFTKIVVWLLAAVTAVWLASQLYAVILPVAAAFVAAFVLDPLAAWLEKRGLSRGNGVLLIFLAFLSAAVLGAVFLVPLLAGEVLHLRDRLPGFLTELPAQMEHILGSIHPELPARFSAWYKQVLSPERLQGLSEHLTGALLSFVAGARAIVGALLGAVVVPVLTFYFLRDLPAIRGGFARFLIKAGHPGWVSVARDMSHVAEAYLRGQFIVIAYLIVAYAFGFIALGVPYGLLIAITGGVLFIIPYFGTLVALVAATLSSIGVNGFELTAVYPALWLGFVQLIEGYVVTPRVMSEKIGLSPPAIIVALMAGAELAGILGMLVAIPGVAMASVLLRAVWQKPAAVSPAVQPVSL